MQRFAPIWFIFTLATALAPITTSATTPDPALTLARVLHCEAGASEPDVRAILHAIENRRRWLRTGLDLVELARRYSTCRHRATPWANAVAALPESELRYVDDARGWLAGDRPLDPCGGRARGWAHPRLVPEDRRLRCEGRLANAFVAR